MMSQPGKQIITIQHIAIHKLIEYNMGKVFLEKSYTKSGGKTSTRPFSQKTISSISLDSQSKVLNSSFLLYVQVGAIKIH